MLKAALKRLLPPAVRSPLRRVLEFVFADLEGTVVEKDVAALEERDVAPAASQWEILEVSADNGSGLYLSGLCRKPGSLGTAKTQRYLRSGFRGVAALRNGQVVGSVWSVTKAESKLPWVHRDLKRLRVGLADGEAYMFDMYIEPEHRGLALSTSLFREAFRGLRARGLVKAKGYYVVDNLPALWMHRVLGYREVGRVRVRQILGLTWRYRYTPLNESATRS